MSSSAGEERRIKQVWREEGAGERGERREEIGKRREEGGGRRQERTRKNAAKRKRDPRKTCELH